jgi:hypothetical protein
LPAGTGGGTYIIDAVYNANADFGGSTDGSHLLTISAAATATAAASASVVFNSSPQDVPLTATVSSPAGVVNEGTETFTILSGTTVIGTPVTVNVSAGAAAAAYALPAGTGSGTYIIQAGYNGTTNFAGSTDNTHTLVISAAASATAAANASTSFSGPAQNVPLNATITSPVGVVNEGTETFTILSGTTPIGTPVTVNVAAGAAAATYALPAGTPLGTYTIEAEYNGTPAFAPSTDMGHSLIVSTEVTAVVAANASTPFNEAARAVPLSATVTSPLGTVNEGTLTFTILSGTTPVGSPVTVDVTAGAAAANYQLPAGTPAGTYIIEAEYNGTPDFTPATDTSHSLTVGAAATATAAANASTPFSEAAQAVPLSATVTSPAGTVDEGTETFTILSSGTPLGTPVTVSVAAGMANASYELPAGTPAGSYTIEADYSGTPDFASSSDSTHNLTVTAPDDLITADSVGWGSQTAALQTASDGLRLLPAGRNTDMPWFDINQVSITLSQSADLNPGDVSVTGITGGNYGPVTISGSGTSNMVLTFAKAISGPDRVTITIGNSKIVTYTRRLDVLPGDVNDDGAVNSTDGVLILRNFTPANPYNMFYDMNGDGAVNMTDFDLYRPQIGTTLPGGEPQLAVGGAGPGVVASLTPNELAPVLATAIAEWASVGLPAQDVAKLRSVTAQITDLPAGYLGSTAIGGTTIYISANADSYGWFVGATSGNTTALANPVAPTGTANDLATTPVGHEDLLTVVMHELGHALGLNDLDPARSPTDLMAETLATGVQRLPSTADVATVIALDAAGIKDPPHPALVDAVLGAANQEALSPLPAPSLTKEIRVEPTGIRRRASARLSTSSATRQEGLQGMRLVVNYRPESAAGDSRRINDSVLLNSLKEKDRA